MPPLQTSLAAVFVYPDRARVSRKGSLTLEAGTQALEISGLPIQLDADSLRASAYGTARARLLGVQAQRVFFVETPAEAIHKLEMEIETLQDSLKQMDALTKLLQGYRANLDSLTAQTETYAMALAAGENTVDAQLALFDTLRARAEKLDAEMQATTASRREVERRLQKLQSELDQQRNARPRERYTAVVEVEVLQAGDLTVELSYVVTGASWKPLYDLRLLDEGEKPALEVGYLAQVSQQTSEPWENVILTLSTARPAMAGILPELKPWYIQPYQPPVPPPQPAPVMRAKTERPMMLAATAPFGEAGAGLPVEEAVEAQASVDTSSGSVTYHINDSVTIPADGAPHKVVVARFALTPVLDYVTAPKLVEAAYRRARNVNDSPYLLLPGAANLFAGDEFIGATRLKLTAPNEKFELYLGVDDRIKVKRELKRRDVEKTILGGKHRQHFGYEITLENLTSGEAVLILHDQLPASKHEDIKVRLENVDPKPTEQSELNLLDWELKLAPKEKCTVRFDFGIEAPQGMNITGLP
jgi:uncharacterized protein (TIGR02231 family)